MSNSKNILILGGDERQKHLNDLLIENKIQCTTIFTSQEKEYLYEYLSAADTVILPLPITKDGENINSDNDELCLNIDEVVNSISPSQTVIGGIITKKIRTIFEDKQIKYFDFYADEGFITYNAFLTAQGTVYLLLENTSEYVVSKKILITGFGRVGKAVSHFMNVMGLDVYVAVRSETQKSEASSYGYRVIDISDIDSTVYLFDFIVNTVPSVIFSNNSIKLIKDDCVYIELASAPFGAEREVFKKHEKKHIFAASLPGKLYPSASAKAIYKSISKYI